MYIPHNVLCNIFSLEKKNCKVAFASNYTDLYETKLVQVWNIAHRFYLPSLRHVVSSTFDRILFFLVRVACIKMLNVFQRVEPIHKMQTRFSICFNYHKNLILITSLIVSTCFLSDSLC